eukprot:7045993-Alexandrium_andersonii.AAC.1
MRVGPLGVDAAAADPLAVVAQGTTALPVLAQAVAGARRAGDVQGPSRAVQRLGKPPAELLPAPPTLAVLVEHLQNPAV